MIGSAPTQEKRALQQKTSQGPVVSSSVHPMTFRAYAPQQGPVVVFSVEVIIDQKVSRWQLREDAKICCRLAFLYADGSAVAMRVIATELFQK